MIAGPDVNRTIKKRKAMCDPPKEKGRQVSPAPPIFAVRRRLHLLRGFFSSASSSVGSARSSSSSVGGGGGGVGGSSSSVGGSSRSVSSGVGGSFRSGGSGVFSLFSRASRESESAGSNSSENDLAHEVYSLNSEWTTRGSMHKANETERKAYLVGRLRGLK
jgi:hypothetical protein